MYYKSREKYDHYYICNCNVDFMRFIVIITIGYVDGMNEIGFPLRS